MTATRSELQAWLDAYDTPDGPDAQTLADFLGIELAPEPATPVGQRLRSPSGVEVADWEVITDAPECDREHLPEGCVPINLSGLADDDLKVAARVVGSGGFGAAIRAELTNRGASS